MLITKMYFFQANDFDDDDDQGPELDLSYLTSGPDLGDVLYMHRIKLRNGNTQMVPKHCLNAKGCETSKPPLWTNGVVVYDASQVKKTGIELC